MDRQAVRTRAASRVERPQPLRKVMAVLILTNIADVPRRGRRYFETIDTLLLEAEESGRHGRRDDHPPSARSIPSKAIRFGHFAMFAALAHELEFSWTARQRRALVRREHGGLLIEGIDTLKEVLELNWQANWQRSVSPISRRFFCARRRLTKTARAEMLTARQR